jgi:hypothetical protein
MEEAKKLEAILMEVAKEYYRSSKIHGPIKSPHEGYGIIKEEFKELEEEIFKKEHLRDKDKMYGEAKHVANTAIRFMMDVCLRGDE